MPAAQESFPASPQFDPVSHIRDNIGLRLRFYDHPLAVGLQEVLRASDGAPSAGDILIAARSRLEEIVCNDSVQARYNYSSSIDRDYPRVFASEIESAVPDYKSLQQSNVTAVNDASKQLLLRGLSGIEADPKVCEAVDSSDLIISSDAVQQEHIKNVIAQTACVAEYLQLRKGRLGSIALKAFNKDVFVPFATRSTSSNLHRALQSLLDSTATLLSASAIGEQAAAKLYSTIAEQVRSQVRQACTELTEVALTDLIAKFNTMKPEGDDGVVIAGRQMTGNNDGDDDAARPYKVRQSYKSTKPVIPAADTAEGDKAPILAVSSVGAAKKQGSRGSVYRIDPLATVSEQDADAMDTLKQALLGIDVIAKWLSKYPDTAADINKLLEMLLANPSAAGSEFLTKRRFSIFYPGEKVATGVKPRRLSPIQTINAGGFSSSLTQQFRLYYCIVDRLNQKCFVVLDAGNKSQFTGKFERHM